MTLSITTTSISQCAERRIFLLCWVSHFLIAVLNDYRYAECRAHIFTFLRTETYNK
jgi:hypothetical protein